MQKSNCLVSAIIGSVKERGHLYMSTDRIMPHFAWTNQFGDMYHFTFCIEGDTSVKPWYYYFWFKGFESQIPRKCITMWKMIRIF